MKTIDPLSHAQGVTESLASVIVHLRTRAGGVWSREPAPALLGSTDAFLDRLTDHIAEEEDVVFPALGSASTGATLRIEALRSDHGSLHESARRLAVRILAGKSDAILLDTARVLMVQLLQHVRSEEDVTRLSLDSLGGTSRVRLARCVSMLRARLGRRGGS